VNLIGHVVAARFFWGSFPLKFCAAKYTFAAQKVGVYFLTSLKRHRGNRNLSPCAFPLSKPLSKHMADLSFWRYKITNCKIGARFVRIDTKRAVATQMDGRMRTCACRVCDKLGRSWHWQKVGKESTDGRLAGMLLTFCPQKPDPIFDENQDTHS
jgi:hypothetical protein